MITMAIGVVITRACLSHAAANAMLLQTSHQSAIPLQTQARAIVASTQRGGPADPTKDPGPHGQPSTG